MRRLHSSAVPGKQVKIMKDANGAYVDFLGKRIYILDVAITTAVTATTAPAGSFGSTTHATGRNALFYSNGSVWTVLA